MMFSEYIALSDTKIRDELLRRVNALGSEERNALLVIVKAMTDK